eukprot:COSAG02_NODE_11079_length_1797_cov_8.536514_2_plen_446_part_00
MLGVFCHIGLLEMIIYEHLSVAQRVLQYKGTVWDDCKYHFLMVNLVTLAVQNVFWAQTIGTTPFVNELLDQPRYEVPIAAWQIFMFPLGFLLGLRSNQAYGRYLDGIAHYRDLIQAAGDLCRQTQYIKTDGEYTITPAGDDPTEGQATCEIPSKQVFVRHALAFLAAVRQDIRNMRLPANDGEDAIDKLADLRLHVTEKELLYLYRTGIYDEDVNSPLIIGRWLTADLAQVVDRIGINSLIGAMERSIQRMLSAYRGIDTLSQHPAPWPYTHLAQTFLIFWVYTLPLCLVPLYNYGTLLIMPVTALTLFGLDAVAREIQDPFGFDENDLNIQGYENILIDDLDTMLDGPLTLGQVDGHSGNVGKEDLKMEMEERENLMALSSTPWKAHGVYVDSQLRKVARKKNNAKSRVQKMSEITRVASGKPASAVAQASNPVSGGNETTNAV